MPGLAMHGVIVVVRVNNCVWILLAALTIMLAGSAVIVRVVNCERILLTALTVAAAAAAAATTTTTFMAGACFSLGTFSFRSLFLARSTRGGGRRRR